MWVRYGTRFPLHGYAARLSDGLLDGHPELAKAFELRDEIPAPDGSRVVVFAATDAPEDVRRRAIASWAETAERERGDAEPLEGDVAAWRLGPGSAPAALRLAASAPGIEALIWLRRALEADGGTAGAVRRGLNERGVPAPGSDAELLATLRRLTAGTTPPR